MQFVLAMQKASVVCWPQSGTHEPVVVFTLHIGVAPHWAVEVAFLQVFSQPPVAELNEQYWLALQAVALALTGNWYWH